MRDRTQHPGPEGLDAVPLAELAAALEGHLGDLERAHAGTDDPRGPGRTQAAAVHARTIIDVIQRRLDALTATAEVGTEPADSDREPAPRDAADMHPATRTGSVTGSVTTQVDDQPAGTGRDHGRGRLHVVTDHHVADDHTVGPRDVESAPAEHDPVALTPGQASDARAYQWAACGDLDADKALHLHEAMQVTVAPGRPLTVGYVVDELYALAGVEFADDVVAACLARAAATRP